MESKAECSSKPSVSFPEDTESFAFQVGGHIHGQGRLKLGMLKHKNGYLVKPLFEDSRANDELNFYRRVHENKDNDPLVETLKSFIPKFSGVWETKFDGKDMKYLCIEDLCAGFQNPSVLDVKMGRITYDENADQWKKDYEISKFPYGETAGMRIVGMKVYDETLKKHVTQEKMVWRKYKFEELASVLEIYLSKNVQINIWLICGMIHKLSEILEWFSVQKKYKFIASSILHVYEGTSTSWYTWAQENGIPIKKKDLQSSNSKECRICGEYVETCSKIVSSPLIRVSMIDFGHATPTSDVDTNYLPGLHNLVNYFKLILESQRGVWCNNSTVDF